MPFNLALQFFVESFSKGFRLVAIFSSFSSPRAVETFQKFGKVIVPKRPFLFNLRILSLSRKHIFSKTLQKLVLFVHVKKKCLLNSLVFVAILPSPKHSAKSGLVAPCVYSSNSPFNSNILLRTLPLTSHWISVCRFMCPLFRL